MLPAPERPLRRSPRDLSGFHRADVLYRYCLGQASPAPPGPSATFRALACSDVCVAPPSLDNKPGRCCALALAALGARGARARGRRDAVRRSALHERPVRPLPAGRRVVPARRPADRGQARGWQRSTVAARAGAPRRSRTPPTRATSPRAATSAACGGTARTSRLPARRGDRLGAALRVGQLPRDRVAERAPARAATAADTSRSRCPAGACAAPASNRLVVRVDSRRDETDVPPIGRRKDGRFIGGWWNYAGILREVYLRRVDTLDLVNVHVFPRQSCPTCPAQVYVRAVAANLQGIPVDAALTGTVGGHTIEFRRATVSRPRLPPVPRQRDDREPAALEPVGPAPLHGEARRRARRTAWCSATRSAPASGPWRWTTAAGCC